MKNDSLCFVVLKKMSLIWLATVLLFSGTVFAGQTVSTAESKAEFVQSDIVDSACEMIVQGKFERAGELLNTTGPNQPSRTAKLAKIIAEYKTIKNRREQKKRDMYTEKLTELEELKHATEANGIRDINDIAKILAAVTSAEEFATEEQKTQLLSDAFVTTVVNDAKLEADKLETQGKWLDSYINCYRFLEILYSDNEDYEKYSDELIEKAGIIASFQDSPCESARQRFADVRASMFTRAINALNFNYVTTIDYRHMAKEAVEKCKFLAGVLKSLPQDTLKDMEESFSFSKPQKNKITAFNAKLSEILSKLNQSPSRMSKDEFVDVFEKVIEINSATVELPKTLLIAQFAQAALNSLDPYTIIVWPTQKDNFEKEITSQFTGIGIEITKEKGMLTVASLLADTPAYYSGLDAGDVIEKVDGIETKDMSLTCAVKNITGPAGTEVTLTVKAPNQEQTRDITITRARIVISTIRGWQRTTPSTEQTQSDPPVQNGKWLYMLDETEKIGYIRLTSFAEKTDEDFEKALDYLEDKGLKGLVLDLRFNSGGLLSTAIKISDKFLDKGTIVITRPRFWVSSTYAAAKKKGTHPDYPIVILINKYSASASEIVAGALADKTHQRAILVGNRTHGKGSVQGIAAYPGSGAQLKYTMAYYHLPSGQRVKSKEQAEKEGKQDWGVGPDVQIKLRSDEMKKMSEVRRANDVLVKADHDTGAAPVEKHTLLETLESDPQLAVAVLVVKTKLIQKENTKKSKL